MKPDEVPDDLLAIASEAWRTAPQKRDGRPTRMRYAIAAVLGALVAETPAAAKDDPLVQWWEAALEQQVRAKVADDLKRAAAGRRDYATRAPEHIAAELESEARVFDTSARVAENPRDVMWGLLPADMWTDADRPERSVEP